MAIILCIETTTTNCSVALSVDGVVVFLKEDNNREYSHAEKLHLFIEDVLVESKVSKNKLDAVAVSRKNCRCYEYDFWGKSWCKWSRKD